MRRAVTIHPIERLNITLSAGAVAASWLLATPAFAVSLAIGAALEAVNFRGLYRSSQLVFGGQLAGRRGRSAGLGLRMALLAVGIAVAIQVGAHPVGLVIGLSLIIPAAIIEAWRSRPAVDPDAPSLPPDDEAWERWNPWLARERRDIAGEEAE